MGLTGLLAATKLLLAAGFRTGFWPASLGRVGLVLLPIALTGAGLGIAVGLLLRPSTPTLLKLTGLALVALVGGLTFAARRTRRLGCETRCG